MINSETNKIHPNDPIITKEGEENKEGKENEGIIRVY